MFKKFLSSILSAAILLSSANAYAISGDEGQFFFRYKAGFTSSEVPNTQSKDIVAYYVGGLNREFSEKLPMKPQWANDDWRVTKGNLPDGISFNNVTFTFEGKPTSITSDTVVELNGYDTLGQEVASAEVHFDIFQLPDNVVDVDYFAHTGKFSSNALKLPADVTVFGDPKLLTAAPAGITYNARYFEGTPTKPGRYPVLAMGYNHLGKAVVAFIGYYTITDGPEFATVADDIREVGYNAYWGCGHGSECAVWFQQPVPKVLRPISDASKVRYYVETENNAALPRGMSVSSDVFKREITGRLFNYYDQVKMRYKAIDTDGTSGYSNWFMIGSGGPKGVCQPIDGAKSTVLWGTAKDTFMKNGYRIPSGRDSAEKAYTVTSGKLPTGLTLDNTGLISGTPTEEATQEGVMVEISFPNSSFPSFTCGPYDFNIGAADFKLQVAGSKADYRVNEAVSVTASAGGIGLIAPYNIELDPSSVLPQGVTFDASTATLNGTAQTVGGFNALLRLKNGDGAERLQNVSFVVHDKLKINDVDQLPSIRQYDVTDNLLSVSFDQATVIGNAAVTLMNGPLPDGFSFDGFSVISGGTRLAPIPGNYGPFFFRLSDSTGEYVDSNMFKIEVTDRADLIASATADPLTYVVDWDAVSVKPFSVEQPALAKNFLPLTYRLTGPALPKGLQFSQDTGYIQGTPTEKTSVSGYAVEITEVSPANLQKTSTPFTITVDEPPLPATVSVAPLKGNVSGPTITSDSPISAIMTQESNILGGIAAVKFLSAEPTVPGLTFRADTGTISGNPTTEFSGNVTITYEDKKQRQGKVVVPVTIFPFPAAKSSQAIYEVPRLSTASGITVSPANTGYYAGVTWALAPGSAPLPHNMKLTGDTISGTPDDPSGTEKTITLRGTSLANGLYADVTFKIRVTDPKPLTLDTTGKKVTIELDPASKQVVSRTPLSPSNNVGGSYVGPLTFSLGSSPSWLTISPAGVLAGDPPKVGDFSADIIVTDSEMRTDSSSFSIRVTYAGDVAISPGQGGLKEVRKGETFKTLPQVVSRDVAPWVATPNTPNGLTFDTSDLTYKGSFDTMPDAANILSAKWNLQITDSHDRTLEQPGSAYAVTVHNALEMPQTVADVTAKQYSAEKPVAIQIPAAKRQMGVINYGIEGDLPGKLYYKTILGGQAVYRHYADNGDVETVTQTAQETVAQTEARLDHDHIIFDPVTLTIMGIPSKTGTFPVRLWAFDDHADHYWQMSDPTREEYNKASTNWFNVTVEASEPLQVVSTVNPKGVVVPDGNANVVLSPKNDTYGLGVSWQVLSSNLPAGINYTINNGVITFSGYSSAVGTYTVSVKATDILGRAATFTQTFKVFISTDPIILNVSNIKTKIGYPAKMEPPFAQTVLSTDNTFGPVKFYSYELPQISGISLNENTGYIDGLFTTPQQFTFDLYATDDTNRITSKPVTVDVIPNLRVIAPAIVLADPYTAVSQTVSTDYALGKVTYEKENPAVWPEGFNVDPATGKITATAPLAAPLGEYPGLKIKATDTFGTQPNIHTDVQPSSSFTVRIETNGPYVRLLDKAFSDIYKRIAYDYDFTVNAEYRNADSSEFSWTWTAASGSKLPPGLIMASTGRISGTPTESGSFDVNITARNKNTASIFSTKKYTILVQLPQSNIAINAKSLTAPRAEVFTFDYKTVTDTTKIDKTKIVYSSTVLKQGQVFPAGMTLNASGILSGTPTKKGRFEFTLVATFTDNNPTAEVYTASQDMVFISDAPEFNYVDVAVGFNHACGATDEGQVLCWGDNSNGQLGDGTTASKVYPTLVVGISDAKKVLAGYYNSCAITASGAMKCWGYNANGQLGDGSTTNKLTPSQVVGMTSGVTDGAMLKYTASPWAPRSCAIQNGGLWCWGSDSYGGLGNTAANAHSAVPVQPVGLSSGVKSVALEYISSHVGMTDGSYRAWGWNGENRLGTNQTAAKIFETALTIPITDVKQALGYIYLSTDGTVRGLSNNVSSVWDSSLGSDNVQASRGSNTLTCVTKTNGTVRCTNIGVVANATSIIKVDVSNNANACGLRSDKKIMCWGTNSAGQLGDGTKINRNNAVIIE